MLANVGERWKKELHLFMYIQQQINNQNSNVSFNLSICSVELNTKWSNGNTQRKFCIFVIIWKPSQREEWQYFREGGQQILVEKWYEHVPMGPQEMAQMDGIQFYRKEGRVCVNFLTK